MTFKLLAADLAGSYSVGWALVAGFVGGLALLAVVYMGFAVGMTRMNFLQILGSMIAPGASTASAEGIGFAVHSMMAAAFGLVHAGLLHALNVGSVGEAIGWDAAIGAGHGLVVLMVLPMLLSTMHPLVRHGQIASPGVALAGFGPLTPLGSLMAHVAFGLVTGAVYAAAVL